MRKKITDFATKKIKDSIMNPNGSHDKNRHAETIIRNHVLWAMTAGAIAPPWVDIFAVSAAQLDMIRQMSRVYNIDFAETQGKAIVFTLTSSTAARAGATGLIKLVPIAGTIIGGGISAVVNGASTYALGEVFKQHFAHGGTFLDFDTERLRKLYNEKFEKGKKVAKEWKDEALFKKKVDKEAADKIAPTPAEVEKIVKEEPKAKDETKAQAKSRAKKVAEVPEMEAAASSAPVIDDDAIRKIKELAEMKAQNIITEEEFEKMKKKIIG